MTGAVPMPKSRGVIDDADSASNVPCWFWC